MGRATPRGDPPGGAETTETETTTETTTNIPTPTTPLAPAPRDEISRSGHQPPHSDNRSIIEFLLIFVNYLYFGVILLLLLPNLLFMLIRFH